MSWEWSHTADAYSDAYEQVHRLPKRELLPEENHKRAARMLIRKLGWFHEEGRGDRYGKWYQGITKAGEYVHVCCVPEAEVKEESCEAQA